MSKQLKSENPLSILGFQLFHRIIDDGKVPLARYIGQSIINSLSSIRLMSFYAKAPSFSSNAVLKCWFFGGKLDIMGLLIEPKIFPGFANLLIVLIRQFFQHPASLGRVRSSPVLRPSSHSQQVYGMRAQHNASMEATKPDLTRRVMWGDTI